MRSNEVERTALEGGYSRLVAQVLAARLDAGDVQSLGLAEATTPTLRQVSPPATFPDMERGASRLFRAVQAGERIGLVCDHDMDGTASAAVLTQGLALLGAQDEQLALFVSHRLTEGYGLCEPVARRILEANRRPTLLITADCGSSDGERIASLAEHGIDTIVTDHHGVGDSAVAQSAVAFINPKREDTPGGDPATAGCGVAWMLISHAARLAGLPDYERRTALAALLDYVAVGTIADCVNLASSSNRALVRYGLQQIQAGARPCWRVAKQWFKNSGPERVASEDIAFQLAPRIASAGRLDTSAPGVRFLLATTQAAAQVAGETLERGNIERRALQAELIEQAQVEAEAQCETGFPVIVIGMPEGHSGVQGLVAGRLAERFARPALVASPRPGAPGTWSGSARGGERADVAKLLALIARDIGPTAMPAHGGHLAAGGFTVRAAPDADPQRLFSAMRAAADKHLPECEMGTAGIGTARLAHDGVLETDSAALLALALELETIEPFGQGFPAAVFRVTLCPRQWRAIGVDKSHWLVECESMRGAPLKLLCFGRGNDWGERYLANHPNLDALVRLQVDRYREPKPALILEALM